MVRRSEQIWMILSVLLTSTWTGALPVTSEPESATLLTTEVATTTSSTIVPNSQENASISSVFTASPAETTLHESDLYLTTEYTVGGDNIVTDPTISTKPSLSSDVSQEIRFEQVALTRDNTTELVNVSSHLTNSIQSKSVDEVVQTTTASWSSSPHTEISTLSQDISTSLYINGSEPTLEAEVSPNITHVTAAHESTSVEFIGPSKENTEDVITNAPISSVTEEYRYSTTEEVLTSTVLTEKTLNLKTVDSEVPQPIKEVHKQFTEDVAKHTQEFESVTNFTKDFKSTEEVKRTEESALPTPTEAAKRTEDASPIPPGEMRTGEVGLSNQTKQESESLGEVLLVTKEVAQTTEEVKNLTTGTSNLHEEFEKQTGEENKLTAGVITDVAVSSGNKSTKAEIFISSGYTPSKANVSSSLDNPRGSRHFTEETSKPQAANGTETQPEINTRKSVLSGLVTNTSVTQSPVTTPKSEPPEPVTSIPLQNNSATGDANLTETRPTSQPTSDTIPTEVNVLNVTSPSATEKPITTLSQLYTNSSQPITPREVSVNSGHAMNVSEPSPTSSVEAKNISASSETQNFLSKKFTSITGPATDPSNSKSSTVITPQSTNEDSETSVFIDTNRASSPASVSLESNVSTMEKAIGGTNMTIACSPEPAVSVFQGDLRYIIVLGLTGCSVAATLLLVTLVLIRLRENKQRDRTSPSLQICGCLGRTQRAEITPRRAEVSEVKLRPGCNLATDADCRAGEGEDVPLALSAGTIKVSAPPAPVSMAAKPNGAPPLPPKPGDSPV